MHESDITQKLFTVDGNPLVIPPRFQELWNEIVFNIHQFCHVMAPTQDGKTITVASATSLSAGLTPEYFTIVAPSNEKADIMMAYVREFVVTCPILAVQLELDPNETFDKLRRNRSKTKLDFKPGGKIHTLSCQELFVNKRAKEASMGKGCKRLIVDERGLISDSTMGTVTRMLAGREFEEIQMIEIGNPFYNNLFETHSTHPRWHKIRFDYETSLYEAGWDWDSDQQKYIRNPNRVWYHGYHPEFIALEQEDNPLFDILYKNLFPPSDAYDRLGYRSEITKEMLNDLIQIGEHQFVPQAEPMRRRLGCDQASGGDYSTIVYRDDFTAKLLFREKCSDETVFASRIMEEARKYSVMPSQCYMDIVNNHATLSHLKSVCKFSATGVNIGEMSNLKRLEKEKRKEDDALQKDKKAQHTLQYDSLKAEASHSCVKWLKKGGKLVENPNWKEILYASKFKSIGDGKTIFFISKEDIKKLDFHSPDVWEGLMLTFAERTTPRSPMIPETERNNETPIAKVQSMWKA